MQTLDYVVVWFFFLLMVAIGIVSFRKVKGSRDFFVAGGKVPWWLAGISHHVSGYSGVVFVGYAVVAYNYGFTLYIWWACSIAVACFIGAWLIAPRWTRLRQRLQIESPTEYLKTRYNLPTQQLMAWSGVLLKLFDVGAKWASIGILLHGFTGLPLSTGIMLSGGISLLYITIGGLWADLYTDLAQFAVQIVAGLVMFVAVVQHLSAVENVGWMQSIFGLWNLPDMPEGHGRAFAGPFSPAFLLAYVPAVLLSYNGGTWNLAARYIAAPSAASSRRSAILSGALYATWPLILFFPMWAAPVLLPDLADPSNTYAELTRRFLPAGLIGLVLASMFANTMSMTTSDTNTISAVITRDILPFMSRRYQGMSQRHALLVARISTLVFTVLTLIIALENERFGGILGLIITWFAALIGPASVPMLLGLLPAFKRAGPFAAITSILGGFVGFVVARWIGGSQAVLVGTPVFTSLILFIGIALASRRHPVRPEVEELMAALSKDAETDAPVTESPTGAR